MASKTVDYSLYLVTDSTPAILGEADLVDVMRQAVEGGATIVQYRDKTSDTAELVRIAKELHKITSAAKVPLLINDRVDVALAAGVEGVHVGQDDLDMKTARKLLGSNAIIGVTANSLEEAVAAARDGADYLGLGTVYATPTKSNAKSIIGTAGVQQILSGLASAGHSAVKTVCIGGVNASNCQRILYQASAPEKALDGIAVVSAIIASSTPRTATQQLQQLIKTPPPFAPASFNPSQTSTPESIIARTPTIIQKLASTQPLCHNMTNLVVQNFAANVALAIGGSPIMSNNGLEAPDLANLKGSLVINMGTTTPETRSNHLAALAAYNAVGGPVLLDPVGAGATAQRREGVKALMAGGYFTVIKGNEGEIRTVAGASGFQQRGVDSGTAQLDLAARAELVRSVARRERNIVLMTGEKDVVSDGTRVVAITNGHALLGAITGSGCALGTTIAAVLAVEREGDRLEAVVAGILMYEIAAERAAEREDVRGPGTFIPAFLDELYTLRNLSRTGQNEWAKSAKIEFL